MSKILITEERLNNLIRVLNEQDNDEYVHIDGATFENMVKMADYNIEGLSKTRKFRGKKIWIDGDLKLSGSPIKSLGNIVVVSGILNVSGCKDLKNLGNLKEVGNRLDISYSSVRSVDGIKCKYISSYGSEMDNIKLRREFNKKLEEQNELRQSGEWDEIGVSTEVDKAWALLKHINNEGDLTATSPENMRRLSELQNQLNELVEQLSNTEDDNEIERLEAQIETINGEISDYDDLIDVYDIIPNRYEHYGMSTFQVNGLGGLRNPNEYSVGTYSEMDEALEDYIENLLDDVGLENLRLDLEYFIDTDSVVEYFEDYYNEDINENPGNYFDDDDYELTTEQVQRKSQLENFIEELDSNIDELVEKLESTEDEDEISRIEEMIEDYKSDKENAEDELNDIEPDTSSPTYDMVSDKVDEMLDDVRKSPEYYLKDFGLDINNFIDMKEVKRYLIEQADYGEMNAYDGSYDTEEVGGETYVIMRFS